MEVAKKGSVSTKFSLCFSLFFLYFLVFPCLLRFTPFLHLLSSSSFYLMLPYSACFLHAHRSEHAHVVTQVETSASGILKALRDHWGFFSFSCAAGFSGVIYWGHPLNNEAWHLWLALGSLYISIIKLSDPQRLKLLWSLNSFSPLSLHYCTHYSGHMAFRFVLY